MTMHRLCPRRASHSITPGLTPLHLVAGLAEPLAVIIMGIVFRAFWLDKMVIDCLLAAVSTADSMHVAAHWIGLTALLHLSSAAPTTV